MWGFIGYRDNREDSRFVEGWVELFELCRVAIENRQPIFAPGLDLLATASEPLRYGKRGERFAIWLTEHSFDGMTQRSCSIFDQNWQRPMTERERGLLLLAFLHIRNNFIGSGTHEDRDEDLLLDGVPLVISNWISASFGTVGLNSAGCEVIVSGSDSSEGEAFIYEGPYFGVRVSEQDREGSGIPCGAPPPPSAAAAAPATQS